LYQDFNDWHLVLAAYNGGRVGVRNAIESSGEKPGDGYFPYLPDRPKLCSLVYCHELLMNMPKYTALSFDTLVLMNAWIP
jgi:soluble lytic murein transglycosylase-like protein